MVAEPLALIDPIAWNDIGENKLEESFASEWVKYYPDIHLMTQVPFAPSPFALKRKTYLRADFAYGTHIQFEGKRKRKPKMLLPPGILIECDGGVHKYTWERDVDRESVARELGFSFHRVYWETLEAKIHEIAREINKSYLNKNSST